MPIRIRETVILPKENFSNRPIDRLILTLYCFESIVFLRKRSDGSPELILLDHGLYEILPQAVRLSLCQFWEAIVLKDRTKMDRYAKELNVDGNYIPPSLHAYCTSPIHSPSFDCADSEKLAEILLQRPIDLRSPQLGSSRLTDNDIAYFQQAAKKHFDIVLDTLKKMPRNMLLVIRYGN